jgi:hypothetical protein
MIEDVMRVAEALARRTDSRRGFLGKIGKAAFVAVAAVAAGIPLSTVVEAGTCSFPWGTCGGCPTYGGCPGGCSADHEFHGSGNCWVNGTVECCDCLCGGSKCGCRSAGVAQPREGRYFRGSAVAAGSPGAAHQTSA